MRGSKQDGSVVTTIRIGSIDIVADMRGWSGRLRIEAIYLANKLRHFVEMAEGVIGGRDR
jgi:hypothetical protein